jgi:hypothetical protein
MGFELNDCEASRHIKMSHRIPEKIHYWCILAGGGGNEDTTKMARKMGRITPKCLLVN